jgi:hypothetical protein
MKIACVGNMNNMLFSLCQYLRELKLDCHLLLFEDEPFLPEHDSYTHAYKEYTHVLPIGKSSLLDRKKRKEVASILKNYDYFIGTDIAPALFYSLGLPLSIFVPHGSDIYSYPFLEPMPEKKSKKIWWLTDVFFVSRMQYYGIKKVPSILFPDEYEVNFPFKDRLQTKSTFYNLTVPMLFAPQYQNLETMEFNENNGHIAFFKELRATKEFIVFSHCRQNGINLPPELHVHEKGNDQLILGYADFVAKNPLLKTCLILFEYGMDIEFSKKLIHQLNIEEYVVWVPKMKRKEIMYGIRLADVGCGEFANSWLTCGVVNEVLATGTPLLHYRNDALYQKDYAELYPLYNAKTSEEISDALQQILATKLDQVPKSKKGIEWIEKFSVEKPVNQILELIQNHSANNFVKGDKWRVFYITTKTKINLFFAKAFFKMRIVFGKVG